MPRSSRLPAYRQLETLTASANDPSRKGELASRKVLFGDKSRYAVAAVHTRFDAVQWFVWDAETPDPLTNSPSVIRQEDTLASAIAELEG